MGIIGSYVMRTLPLSDKKINWKKHPSRAGDYAAFARQKGSERRPIAEGLY
jgi:hypothetical protein